MGQYRAKPQVDDDLIRAAEWIKQDNPAAALRFLDAAFHGFEFLERNPEAGPRGRFRQRAAQRCPVLGPASTVQQVAVFYRIESDAVCILSALWCPELAR